MPCAAVDSAHAAIIATTARASAKPTALTGEEIQARMRPSGDSPFTADHSRVCRTVRAPRPVREPAWSSLEEWTDVPRKGDTVPSMLDETTQRADVLETAVGAVRTWGSADVADDRHAY